MIALSWFLSSSPLRPMNFSEAPQNGLKAQIGDHAVKTELTSLNRYQNFLYWARYLGFATIVGGASDAEDINSRRVIPDPLRAIESALPVIFFDVDDLPIEQFLARLAAIYPVFETGSVRQDFDAMRLTPLTESDKRLSITTSLTLKRLVDRRRLTMTSVADANVRILDFGSHEGRVSRVGFRGVS